MRIVIICNFLSGKEKHKTRQHAENMLPGL